MNEAEVKKNLQLIENGELVSEEVMKKFTESITTENLDSLIGLVNDISKDKINMLNIISVQCYVYGNNDVIIPLLQKALEYDQLDYTTLFNLSTILNNFNQTELALMFANKIEKKDQEVIDLIEKINRKKPRNLENALDIEQNDVKFTGERAIINKEVKENYNDVYEEHVERYRFASKFVKDKVVLDAACGAGYGSKMFAEAGAEHVFSVDISEDNLKNAANTYSDEKINFIIGDVNNLSFEDKKFDVIVSFETIEHIKDGAVWIKESSRVLKDDGIFIVSTPNRYVGNIGLFFNEHPANKFHEYEYTITEFIGELLKEYDIIELYGQTFFNECDYNINKAIRQQRGFTAEYTGQKMDYNNHKLIPLGEVKDVQPSYAVAVCRKKRR